MRGVDVFDGFELNDDLVIHYNICPKTFIKSNSSKGYWHGNLALHTQSLFFEDVT